MTDSRRPYLICATQRSGSTLLCEALRATGVAGQPDEFFDPSTMRELAAEWNTTDPLGYLRLVRHRRSSPGGVFGVKVMYPDLVRFLNSARRDETPVTTAAGLAALLPDARHIWITRRDRVRQAVSYWRAIQTEQWTSCEQRSVDSSESYSFARIAKLRDYVLACDRGWETYFVSLGSAPHVVVYEDFVGEYKQTVTAVLGYLGLPPVPIPAQAPLLKQADTLSELWVDRFLAESTQPIGFSSVRPPR